MTTRDDRRAVKNAAKIVDRRKPGWFRRIVFKRLDLSVECDCIGGQTGIPWTDLSDEFERRYPVDALEVAVFADNDLRDLWIDEVRARRKATAAS